MPKHIVCVHPGGPSQMVGDERMVTDKEWEAMKKLKAGSYAIWQLKRDMGEDVEAVQAPDQTPEPAAVDHVENSELEVRKPAKRSLKGERSALPEEE